MIKINKITDTKINSEDNFADFSIYCICNYFNNTEKYFKTFRGFDISENWSKPGAAIKYYYKKTESHMHKIDDLFLSDERAYNFVFKDLSDLKDKKIIWFIPLFLEYKSNV